MTYYYWDEVNDNLFGEEDESGEVVASYTHEPGLYGELIAQQRNGETRYYNFDGLDNTSELIDENENVTDTYEYSAFGEEIARTGKTENPFGYKGVRGYYTNNDTNDVYVRERSYEATNGRWLSVGPLAQSLGLVIAAANAVNAYSLSSPLGGRIAFETHELDVQYSPRPPFDEVPSGDVLAIGGCNMCPCPPTDPLATGPCNIRFFVGHYGNEAEAFLKANSKENSSIRTGCGNYVGAVACFSGLYNAKIPEESKIPRFPNFGTSVLDERKALRTTLTALSRSKDFADELCRKRLKFCDDGDPARYECGRQNQRCDTVTISITCDQDARTLFSTGIGPSGRKVLEPGTVSKGLCSTNIVFDCCEEVAPL